MAWLSAARALSSCSYMRKRLPHPKARIETLEPVRPRVRVGSGFAGTSPCATSFSNHAPAPVAAPSPIFSRNFLRERSLPMGFSWFWTRSELHALIRLGPARCRRYTC